MLRVLCTRKVGAGLNINFDLHSSGLLRIYRKLLGVQVTKVVWLQSSGIIGCII